MTMRLLYVVIAVAVVAPLSGSALSAQQKPPRTCPAAASGWMTVDRDTWWDNTVAGFESEGIPVYDQFGNFTAEFDALASELGFSSGAALEDFVRNEQFLELDLNRDDTVCMKSLPEAAPIPDYFFMGKDNKASVPQGRGR